MLPGIKKILYATDLSESAKRALDWAMSLAEQHDAAISILHVMPDLVEEMSAGMGYNLEAHFGADQLADFNTEGKSAARESVTKRIQEVCSQTKDTLPSCRLDLNHIIIKAGHPVREIVDTAQEGGYDLVVMGRHGHGIIDEFLMGSVARGVVQKCPLPVLTVRLED